MRGAEFIRLIQRHGRKAGVPVRFDERRGKGTLHAMLADLGLTLLDLR